MTWAGLMCKFIQRRTYCKNHKILREKLLCQSVCREMQKEVPPKCFLMKAEILILTEMSKKTPIWTALVKLSTREKLRHLFDVLWRRDVRSVAASTSLPGPGPSCPAAGARPEAHDPGVSAQAEGRGFPFAGSTSSEAEHVSQRHVDTPWGHRHSHGCGYIRWPQTRHCLQQHPHTGLRFNKI